MSSFLCFLCHSTVNADTNEEIREKYKEVVGMHLCMDSHLCYICCHMLNKLWLFRAVCLKRSLEYPVLFSERGTLNLQRNDLEINTICSDEVCGHNQHRNINSKFYQISYEDTGTMTNQEFVDNVDNQYVELKDDRTDFEEYFRQNDATPSQDCLQEKINSVKHNAYINDETEDHIPQEEEHSNYQDENVNSDTDFHDLDNNISNNINYEHNNIEIDNFETQNEEMNEEEKMIINNETNLQTEITDDKVKKKKSKKSKKKSYEKIILSLDEQKGELDRRRKEKKYMEAVYKCYSCAQGFLFKDTYQTHMMRHEESNGEYRCSICTLRFATPAVLRAHKSNHSERYLCARCNERVVPRARNTHARKCWKKNGDQVACHLCAGMFQDGAGLQQHLKRFHLTRTSNRSYPCSVCGKTYGNQAAVRTHMIKHINRKFDCKECTSTFSSPYTLAQHKKKKHSSINTEQHYCQICNIGYGSRKSLLAHKRNALSHQQTIFECPFCSRLSPNQRSLASHIESVHSTSKNYCCQHCNARYTNRKSFVRHIATHGGKKPAKMAVCHLCGATFKGNNKLNRHLREVCEKAKLEEEFANLYQQDCMDMNPG